MAKCKNCQIEVLDVTEVCPLCRSILEQTEPLEDMYPNVRVRVKGMKLASRIYLFAAAVLFAVLLQVDALDGGPVWWSLLVGLALLSVYLILRYAIMGQSGYRAKVIVLTALGVLLAVAADFTTGYRGWSVDYVLPGCILAVDGVVLGCMLCNLRRWYSYLMWQLLMILCSLLPAALYLLGMEHNAVMAFLPLAVSAAIFLGTMLIGDRSARQELARRFYF